MAEQNGDHDRVVVASRFADGSAAQTPDYTFIGDKETSIAATKDQLATQAVSAVDVKLRGASSGGLGTNAGDNDMDPAVQKLADAHEKAADSATKSAASEVEGRFETADDMKGTANPAAAPDDSKATNSTKSTTTTTTTNTDAATKADAPAKTDK